MKHREESIHWDGVLIFGVVNPKSTQDAVLWSLCAWYQDIANYGTLTCHAALAGSPPYLRDEDEVSSLIFYAKVRGD